MNYNKIVFFLLIICLAFYEAAEMMLVSAAQVEMGSEESVRLYIFALTALSMCFFFNATNINNCIKNSFLALFAYMCVLTLLQSFGTTSVFGLIQVFATIMMPFFIFCFFVQVGKQIEYRFIFIGLIIAYIIMMYAFVRSYELRLLYSNSDYIRIGESYIIYFLLPFFLITRNNLIRILSILFVIVVMTISLKRGGIVSLSLGLISYYLTNVFCTKGTRKLKHFGIAFLLLIVIYFVLTFAMQDYFNNLIERMNGIENDEGSSRFSVYAVTWQMIVNSDFIHSIFGHGWNKVLEDSPMSFSAHNDFLEIMYDFGVIGIILYLYLYYKLFKYAISLIHKRSSIAAPFVYSIVIFIVNSLLSHVIIYPFNMIAFAAVWGYLIGTEKSNCKMIDKKNKKNENRSTYVSCRS